MTPSMQLGHGHVTRAHAMWATCRSCTVRDQRAQATYCMCTQPSAEERRKIVAGSRRASLNNLWRERSPEARANVCPEGQGRCRWIAPRFFKPPLARTQSRGTSKRMPRRPGALCSRASPFTCAPCARPRQRSRQRPPSATQGRSRQSQPRGRGRRRGRRPGRGRRGARP